MIGYGMLYAIAIALPLLLAATVCSAVLRKQGRAERGVWLIALAVSLTLPVIALNGPPAPPPADPIPVLETGLIGLPTVVAVPAAPVVTLPVARSPLGLDEILVGLWLLASLVLVIRWAVAAVRLARLTGSCPATTIDGVRVSLTSDLGPAVSGVVKPRILVPPWLVSMPEQQRSLVLLHEEEHVRARDPLLIVVSRIARICAPWNPFVWLLSSRLLRAVELDCDRRVLRRYPDVEAYGSTLLTVSSRDPGGLVGAAAFAESEAPLRNRILAMTTPPGTVSVVGIFTALVLGILLLVGVFEVPVPAATRHGEPDPSAAAPLDVEWAEEGELLDFEGRFIALSEELAQRDMVAERVVELEEEMRALEASRLEALQRAELAEARLREMRERARAGGTGLSGFSGGAGASRRADRARSGTITGVARDEVSGQPLGGVQVSLRGTGIGGLSNSQGRLLLLGVPAGEYEVNAQLIGYRSVTQTVSVVEGGTVTSDFHLRETAVQLDGVVVTEEGGRSSIRLRGTGTGADSGKPLIYVDDVLVQSPDGPVQAFLDALAERYDIERVEVVKPDAARALYGDEASGGVVQITLKREAARPEPTVQGIVPEAPVFTPFTVAPRVRNMEEVRRAMVAAYPPELRAEGIGGTVHVYFFVDDEGVVRDFRIDESSGQEALDDAALAVAGVYRFSPALNRDRRVPVWVSFPITFLHAP